VYYPTHQLFLGNRSIYIIVFNLVDPSSEARIDFWLQSIKARATKLNVIIVATHADDPHAGTPEEVKQRLVRIKNKAKQILRSFQGLSVLQVSPMAASGYLGIDQLRTEIEKTIARQRFVFQKIPNSYFLFEEMLLETRRKLSVPVISFSEAKVLAILAQLEKNSEIPEVSEVSESGTIDDDPPSAPNSEKQKSYISDPAPPAKKKIPDQEHPRESNKSLITALELLHDLGSILFFPDDAHLNDKLVLDPQWLANLMASLFTTKHTWVSL
jgi:hypothetical protein